MSNPFSMQTSAYSAPLYPQEYYPQNISEAYPTYNQAALQQKTNGPSVLGMMTLGALGGGTVGFFKNRYPVGKDGSISDSFAKEVFASNLKKNRPDTTQQYFKQLSNILKKIDKVNSPEEFKKLLNANKSIIEEQCKGISSDSLLDAVNSTNLKDIKKSLKDTLTGIMNFELQKTKNAIKLGWNCETKKFIKTDEFKDNKLFDIIKNTKNKNQWKKSLKYGGITAGILGALTILYKIFLPSK